MSVDPRILGDTIRDARMKKGYTQEEFSEKLGISLVHLANIEGSRRKPSVPLLFEMMELLDFSVDALVFPGRRQENMLHLDGLSKKEAEIVMRLVDVMKE